MEKIKHARTAKSVGGMPDRVLATHILSIAAEQGLFECERDPISSSMRITFRTEFTAVEVYYLKALFKAFNIEEGESADITCGIVKTARSRTAGSK